MKFSCNWFVVTSCILIIVLSIYVVILISESKSAAKFNTTLNVICVYLGVPVTFKDVRSVKLYPDVYSIVDKANVIHNFSRPVNCYSIERRK